MENEWFGGSFSVAVNCFVVYQSTLLPYLVFLLSKGKQELLKGVSTWNHNKKGRGEPLAYARKQKWPS